MRTEMYIAGEWRPAESGATFETIDPATEQPIAAVARGAAADIDAAARAADASGIARKSVPVASSTNSAMLRRGHGGDRSIAVPP